MRGKQPQLEATARVNQRAFFCPSFQPCAFTVAVQLQTGPSKAPTTPTITTTGRDKEGAHILSQYALFPSLAKASTYSARQAERVKQHVLLAERHKKKQVAGAGREPPSRGDGGHTGHWRQ